MRYSEKNKQNLGSLMVKAVFGVSVNIVKALQDNKITYAEWFNYSKESLNKCAIEELNKRLN